MDRGIDVEVDVDIDVDVDVYTFDVLYFPFTKLSNLLLFALKEPKAEDSHKKSMNK